MPCDIHMFMFMITFTLCFTMGKAHGCKKFSKCNGQKSLSSCPKSLIFENPPYLGSLTSTQRSTTLLQGNLVGVAAWYDYEHLALFEAPCIIIPISVHSLILSLARLPSSSLDQSLMKGCDQCWLGTQFGRIELSVLVSVSKIQTRIESDFWNKNWVKKTESSFKIGIEHSVQELESKLEFLKLLFCEEKGLKPGVNWQLIASYRLSYLNYCFFKNWTRIELKVFNFF